MVALAFGLALGGCSDDSGGVADAGVDLPRGADGLLRDGPAPDGLVADRGTPDLSMDLAADIRVDQPQPDLRVDQPQPDASPDVGTPDLLAPDLPAPDLPTTVAIGNGSCGSATMYPVSPGPTEDGHLAAARLTPKSYPFTVTQIRYALLPAVPSVKCDTGLAHRVEVFVAKAKAPPASPTVTHTLQNPKVVNGSVIRVITHDLIPPLTLQQGDELFVSVELRYASASSFSCLRSCWLPTAPTERDYWSNAKTAPYPWVKLSSFGVTAFYSTQALGY
jgi:hypothetical protein